MTNQNKIFSWIFYLAVIALLVLFALQKVWDTDVWLHLGLGKYMVEHRALPAGDIFSYTSYGMPFEYFEWLFEVFLYLLFRYTGYHGLMVFKLVLWLLTTGLLWQWMKTEGVESRWAAFITIFSGFLLIERWRERPEIVGYFFLVFYLWIWSQYRVRGRNYLYFLPLMQILWINLHSSALMGIAVFIVILAGEGFDYLWKKKRENLQLIKVLLLIIALLVGGSFINPYGYKVMVYPLLYSQQEALKKGVIEWMPIWKFKKFHYIYILFLIYGVLSFIPILRRRPRENLKPAELLLFVFGALLPYVSARHVAFFALIALPLAGKNYCRFFFNWEVSIPLVTGARPLRPLARWFLLAVILLLGGILFWGSPRRSVFGWGPENLAVPQKAVAFIKNHSLPGPIFNYFPWGGYLILEAYPSYPVFIDSRAFDFEVMQEYLTIMRAEPGWKRKLELRGVNLIMTNALMPASGSVWPLVVELIVDPDWTLINNEETALVFMRNRPENQSWLKSSALSKSSVYSEIIRESMFLIDKFNEGGQTYYSLAWAYMSQGDFREAKAAFQEHLKINPHDQEAARTLDFLTKQGY